MIITTLLNQHIFLKKNIIKPKIINNNIKKKYLSKFHLDTIADKYLAIFNKVKKNNND